MSKSNADRIGVWGASGSGKSSYVKQKITNVKRIVVFDPLDEYKSLKMSRCMTVDEVRKCMVSNWDNFRVAYVPPVSKEARALSQLSKLLLKAQEPFKARGSGKQVTLVVEEMNKSFPVKGGDSQAVGFAEICSRGRHSGIEVYGLSQRIAEVNTRFRGNCTQTVVLRQQGAVDIAAASNALGVGKPTVAALKNLEYIHERNGEITNGKISFAKK